MSLSTLPGSGIRDSWGGMDDIRSGRYRYLRNGHYKESPLYKAKKDVEILSVLLYFQIVLEAELDPTALTNQPGIPEASRVIDEVTATLETALALGESAYLRARLLYLFKNAVAAARSKAELERLSSAVGLDRFVAYLEESGSPLGARLKQLRDSTDETLVSSFHLGGDLFRLPELTAGWKAWDKAEAAWKVAIQRSKHPGEGTEELTLGPNQALLLASPAIGLNPGVTPCARITDGASRPSGLHDELVLEFIAFGVHLPDDVYLALTQYYDDASLAALLVLHAGETTEIPGGFRAATCAFFPIPSACHLRKAHPGQNPWRSLFVRCNCLGLLQNAVSICAGLAGSSRRPTLQLFLLGWQDAPKPAGLGCGTSPAGSAISEPYC
jgi:hypothetical protein